MVQDHREDLRPAGRRYGRNSTNGSLRRHRPRWSHSFHSQTIFVYQTLAWHDHGRVHSSVIVTYPGHVVLIPYHFFFQNARNTPRSTTVLSASFLKSKMERQCTTIFRFLRNLSRRVRLLGRQTTLFTSQAMHGIKTTMASSSKWTLR